MEGLEIRRMRAGEAEQVAALEKECFPDPWSANSLSDMLGNPHALYLVAVMDGQLIGYCGTRTVLDEGDILRVAITREYRGRKIGSELLRTLLMKTPDIDSWNLDVREHNEPAIGLYRKYGFEPIGKRKHYYHHPEEDAILMQRRKKEKYY